MSSGHQWVLGRVLPGPANSEETAEWTCSVCSSFVLDSSVSVPRPGRRVAPAGRQIYMTSLPCHVLVALLVTES